MSVFVTIFCGTRRQRVADDSDAVAEWRLGDADGLGQVIMLYSGEFCTSIKSCLWQAQRY